MPKQLVALVLTSVVLLTTGCTSGSPDQSGVFVTRNAGEEWIAAPDLSTKDAKKPKEYPPLEVTAVEMSDTDPNFVLAGTADDLFRTYDGGRGWERLTERLPAAKNKALEVQSIVFDQANPSTFYVTGVTSGYGKVIKSTDRGETLKEVFTTSQPKLTISSLLVDTKNPGTVYIGDQSGSVFKSTDAGGTWQRLFGAPQTISSITGSGDTIYLGTVGNGVYRSSDAGRTFTSASGGLSGGQLTVYTLAQGFGAIYAGTDAGLLATRNGGATWKNVGTPLPAEQARVQALSISGDNIFFATNAVVYRLPAGGDTFVPAQLRLANNVFSLTSTPTDPNLLYAGASSSKSNFSDRYGNSALTGTRIQAPFGS